MNTIAVKSALTKLKELSSYPKAKRNDVVVIELTSSYTTAKFKTERSVSYYLAKVTKTSQGRVVDYIKANGSRGIVDARHRVMCISEADKQAAVRDLFGTELGAMDFDNLDQVKAAILDRVEALR
jgi:hypothetical protein